MRRMRIAFVGASALIAALGIGFVWNGANSSWKTPEFARGPVPVRDAGPTLRVMAFNIAKARFYEGGHFRERALVAAELDAIAAGIVREDCDVVCLSEVVLECGPQPLNQVEYLAERANYAHCAASENYSFGLPFFRIRSGNAVLSRIAMRSIEVLQLAGEKPLWSPTNNRRALVCELALTGPCFREHWRSSSGYDCLGSGIVDGDECRTLLVSLRNDSFDLSNNLRQTAELIEGLGAQPAILAGDFNAEPSDRSFDVLRQSKRFSGFVDGPPTFPADAPQRRIDHVLAPREWRLVEQHTARIGT